VTTMHTVGADGESAWPAPAKLNLFLHVTGRRADGYHELQTLFQLVDLADELRIRVRDDGRIVRTAGPAEVPPDADLVVRAARLLRERAGRPQLGAELAVTKRIPLGGGLGGGSSDAATTLVALDRLWGLGVAPDELASLGLQLGADVPVFVRGATALAEGIGERLTPVDVAPAWFAIVHPGIGVATATVFQAPELTRNSVPIKIRGSFSPGWPGQELPGRNDLEPVVAARHAPVRAALDWLGRRGRARLTGSGACVFAAYADERAARAALDGLPAEWSGFVAAGLTRSPLLQRTRGEPAAG
jgi:4-diphosphocytidyl-2-C-methyl-D-erythritol kinase